MTSEANKTAASHAFAARCLLRAARSATLATQFAGHPFASLVTPAVTPDGTVLLLLSGLSAHTSHLRADPRCALLVTGPAAEANPQTAPRLTVVATAAPEPDPALRRFWVSRHPYAALYADFTDFGLWRLVTLQAHYVGGFGLARRLAANTLAPPAQAVPTQAAQDGIIARWNTGCAGALAAAARRAGGAGAWRLLGVDADGIDLAQDEAVLRVAFDRQAEDADQLEAALSRLVQAARLV